MTRKIENQTYKVGYCIKCGEGHHLENGLCFDCRKSQPISKAAQAILKPEWDKMQDFISQMDKFYAENK